MERLKKAHERSDRNVLQDLNTDLSEGATVQEEEVEQEDDDRAKKERDADAEDERISLISFSTTDFSTDTQNVDVLRKQTKQKAENQELDETEWICGSTLVGN